MNTIKLPRRIDPVREPSKAPDKMAADSMACDKGSYRNTLVLPVEEEGLCGILKQFYMFAPQALILIVICSQQ